MLSGMLGAFFGATIGTGASPGFGMYYDIIDLIFLFVIGVSFFMYYKMYIFVKIKKFAPKMIKTLKYILAALSLINIMFIAILIEFMYMREYFEVYLPISNKIIFLGIALIALYLIVKAYGTMCCEELEHVTIRKKGSKKRSKKISKK